MSSPATILIVDDDVDARELLRLYLSDGGYHVVEADDGERAVELAATLAPDLIIMDVMLPRLNGFEAARRIKQQLSSQYLPIIIVTTLRDQSSKLLSYRIGADDFLSHPVDRIELGVRVARLLDLRAQHLALARRNEELVELQRFRDEMSSTVVHDLKNPLAVILANLTYTVEELRRVPGLDPDLIAALSESHEAGRRLLRLLTNLADVARMEASRLDAAVQPTPVGRLLQQIAAQRRIMTQTREIRVDVRLPADEVEAALDADLVTRAVENVFDNALRYTPSGGTIALSARRLDGDAVEIAVGNDGPPIPEEARHAIFEKYGQHGRRSGRMNLGLGLYFCRLAAEAHGGSLELRSTDEFPTLFCFRLPLKRAPRASTDTTAGAADATGTPTRSG